MSKPHLLILSYTDARRDPRVNRQVKYLKQDFQITLAGVADLGFEDVDFLQIKRRAKSKWNQAWIALNLLLRRYAPALGRFFLVDKKQAQGKQFDLILVNDAEPLGLAFELAKGAPVVFDAHEYYPKEFEHSFLWRLLFQPYMKHLCSKYLSQCAAITTVSCGIAHAYHQSYGVMPTVVYSAPGYQDIQPGEPDPENIKLIHHGGANPDRCIELMIEMMDYVDKRFTLDLYLVGAGSYWENLRQMAESRKNINWREPVPMQDIPATANRYDVGVYILKPTGFNTTHALPNKFFEFIQARLAIAVGPSPEMAKIINEHQLGVVAEDFAPQSLGRLLNSLDEKAIYKFKENSDVVACKFSAQASMQVMRGVLNDVLACSKNILQQRVN